MEDILNDLTSVASVRIVNLGLDLRKEDVRGMKERRRLVDNMVGCQATVVTCATNMSE